MNTPVTTNGDASTWAPTVTWDSTNGYTLGFSHGHPGGTGPSPADVFAIFTQIGHNPLRSVSASDLQYYEKNASVTTMTSTGSYIVSISNWTALTNIYNNSYATTTEQANFVSNYQNQGDIYSQNNINATPGDAGAWALIQMFPGAINIYYAPPNSTNYSPLAVSTKNSKTLVTIPCPVI